MLPTKPVVAVPNSAVIVVSADAAEGADVVDCAIAAAASEAIVSVCANILTIGTAFGM